MIRKLIRLAVVAVATFFVFTFVVSVAVVDGESMDQTYRDGGFTLINRLSYWRRPPARGEVVAIKLAGRQLMFLKRIVGLPGETVEIRAGQVLIDGLLLTEPYLTAPWPWALPPRALTDGEYFVIGDNRRQPIEQHFFGRVDIGQIVGRALW